MNHLNLNDMALGPKMVTELLMFAEDAHILEGSEFPYEEHIKNKEW